MLSSLGTVIRWKCGNCRRRSPDDAETRRRVCHRSLYWRSRFEESESVPGNFAMISFNFMAKQDAVTFPGLVRRREGIVMSGFFETAGPLYSTSLRISSSKKSHVTVAIDPTSRTAAMYRGLLHTIAGSSHSETWWPVSPVRHMVFQKSVGHRGDVFQRHTTSSREPAWVPTGRKRGGGKIPFWGPRATRVSSSNVSSFWRWTRHCHFFGNATGVRREIHNDR